MTKNLLAAFAARLPVSLVERPAAPAACRAEGVVRYSTSAINPDGSVAWQRAFKKNLILDQGLNLVATVPWVTCFSSCAVGTGTTATKRDSGAITFSRSGTTITANAGFFDPADVGRLLKWDTGEEVYITGYTSATVATSTTSGTITSAQGTIWYVNQTALTAETTRTANYSADAGDNQTTFSTPTVTHKRTFLFPAVGANVTYNEIGWSNNAGAGANLFGRDVIPGGDVLLTGQQYKVIVTLLITISPVTSTAVADVGNNGFNTAGNANHEYIDQAYGVIAAGGSGTAGYLEPSAVTVCNFNDGAFTLLSAPSYTIASIADFGRVALTNAAYTNGNFYRDSSGTVAVGNGNSATVSSVTFGWSGGGVVGRGFSVKFTSDQTKDNLHTLTATLRKSWGRVLTN